eukprot:TRINITY_DN22270_c0_g1_i2.p1 TRINITY_DN22270_c0_g1~~TRINITY_DN22270_c0_g1_i2.p1  ORF type:complete len:1385 (+),score=118.61 TRINITY_DN22270_c0_g1_i2:144-4298(+)
MFVGPRICCLVGFTMLSARANARPCGTSPSVCTTVGAQHGCSEYCTNFLQCTSNGQGSVHQCNSPLVFDETLNNCEWVNSADLSYVKPGYPCPPGQPSASPTTFPTLGTASPTRAPSNSPMKAPSTAPSRAPSAPLATSAPSNSPSPRPPPTAVPTNIPTLAPSAPPSASPARSPTRAPAAPTHPPSSLPSPRPSFRPSSSPRRHPTLPPTHPPSTVPSRRPTRSPTSRPENPSASPTDLPTQLPSLPPMQPSAKPSNLPTQPPTLQPKQPSAGPTQLPTRLPTAQPKRPSASPTHAPTRPPTPQPMAMPSVSPTSPPWGTPTTSPTKQPATAGPSARPSGAPSLSPSAPGATSSPSSPPAVSSPTVSPSRRPSRAPTRAPTSSPAAAPTPYPSTPPSAGPSASPQAAPTARPSGAPSRHPSHNGDTSPPMAPTAAPSRAPSAAPRTGLPSSAPTGAPLQAPSAEPSRRPSASPATTASASPSQSPEQRTVPPTTPPTGHPERDLLQPTVSPSARSNGTWPTSNTTSPANGSASGSSGGSLPVPTGSPSSPPTGPTPPPTPAVTGPGPEDTVTIEINGSCLTANVSKNLTSRQSDAELLDDVVGHHHDKITKEDCVDGDSNQQWMFGEDGKIELARLPHLCLSDEVDIYMRLRLCSNTTANYSFDPTTMRIVDNDAGKCFYLPPDAQDHAALKSMPCGLNSTQFQIQVVREAAEANLFLAIFAAAALVLVVTLCVVVACLLVRRKPAKAAPEGHAGTFTLGNAAYQSLDTSLANMSPRHGKPNVPKKWQKGQLLGRGSFGSVFMGIRQDGTLMAVKIVNLGAGLDQEQLDALMREVEVMSGLSHHHIVDYFGCTYEQDSNELAIYMEYMDGGSLGSFVRKLQEPLAEQAAATYLRQITEGVAYLHAHKVIHRDLKGDNILMAQEGRCVKIADFGTSKRLRNAVDEAAQTAATTMAGTPLWMAPEVINARENKESYSLKADVWSIGVVACELLNKGRPPWPAFQSTWQAVFTIGNHTAALPPQMPQGLSPEALDFMRLCFNPVPDKRGSVQDLQAHKWLSVGEAVPDVAATIRSIADLKKVYQEKAEKASQGSLRDDDIEEWNCGAFLTPSTPGEESSPVQPRPTAAGRGTAASRHLSSRGGRSLGAGSPLQRKAASPAGNGHPMPSGAETVGWGSIAETARGAKPPAAAPAGAETVGWGSIAETTGGAKSPPAPGPAGAETVGWGSIVDQGSFSYPRQTAGRGAQSPRAAGQETVGWGSLAETTRSPRRTQSGRGAWAHGTLADSTGRKRASTNQQSNPLAGAETVGWGSIVDEPAALPTPATGSPLPREISSDTSFTAARPALSKQALVKSPSTKPVRKPRRKQASSTASRASVSGPADRQAI